MFTYGEDTVDGKPRITLRGVINEDVNFNEALGDRDGELHLLCRDITRINSMGIKMWCQYFQRQRSRGVKLFFYESSPDLTVQCNYVTIMMRPEEIVSLTIRHVCTSCRAEKVSIMSAKELAARSYHINSIPCEECGQQSVFDEVEEDYFSFLINS